MLYCILFLFKKCAHELNNQLYTYTSIIYIYIYCINILGVTFQKEMIAGSCDLGLLRERERETETPADKIGLPIPW